MLEVTFRKGTFTKIRLPRATIWILVQIMTAGLAFSQVLTHGPVVGGVTSSSANVFVRTDQAASVVLRYGTDPNLQTYRVSGAFQTRAPNDFTKIIALSSLPAQTTIYINVVANGVSQFASPPYPSFTTFPSNGTSKDFNFVVLSDFKNTALLTNSVQTFASAAAEAPAFVFIGGDFDHRNPLTLLGKRKMFKDLYDAKS